MKPADVVLQANNLIEEIYQVAKGRGGTVRMGFGPAPSHTFLSEVISLCRKSSPQLTLETAIGSTQQLAELMQNGKIDLAICPLDKDLFKTPLDTQLLLEEHVVIAARPEHPIFLKPLTDPGSFFGHQVVLPVLEPRYRLLTKQLYNIDVAKLSNLVLCSDYTVLIKLILSGDFITAGPRFTFREEIEKGNLKVIVMDERVKHRIHLIANRSALNFPALENVILNIQQVVKNQPN